MSVIQTLPNGFPPVKREHLADHVYRVLWRYILHTGLSVGERLPSERKLSDTLEVSRTVVRAALQRMEEEGYVERRVGVGVTLIQRPSQLNSDEDIESTDFVDSVYDLYHARIALEVGAVDWIIKALTDDDLAELEMHVSRIEEKVRTNQSTIRDDRAFHKKLIEITHNPVLIRFSVIIDQYFEQVRHSFPEVSIDRRASYLDVRHRMVMMALQARDVEACRQALRFHFAPLPFSDASIANGATEP